MSRSAILTKEGGPHAVALRIAGRIGEADLARVQSRVRGWSLQGSIPNKYWRLLDELGIATLDELASAAEARKLPDAAARRTTTEQGAAAA